MKEQHSEAENRTELYEDVLLEKKNYGQGCIESFSGME